MIECLAKENKNVRINQQKNTSTKKKEKSSLLKFYDLLLETVAMHEYLFQFYKVNIDILD